MRISVLQVVPGLLMVLDDTANPRVQAHAGAALVNFSEDCPKAILALYLDTIIAKLEQVLTSKFNEVCEPRIGELLCNGSLFVLNLKCPKQKSTPFELEVHRKLSCTLVQLFCLKVSFVFLLLNLCNFFHFTIVYKMQKTNFHVEILYFHPVLALTFVLESQCNWTSLLSQCIVLHVAEIQES